MKKLEGNTAARVAPTRRRLPLRFIDYPPARSTFTPSCTVPKPTANLEHSPDDTAHLSLATAAVPFVLACVFEHMRRRHSSHS